MKINSNEQFGNSTMWLEWIKQFRAWKPSHEKFRAASVAQYYQTTSSDNQPTNFNGIIIPPLDFKNERIIDKTREWTVENKKDDLIDDSKPTDGRHSVLPIETTFHNDLEKKNIITFKNQISQNSVATAEDITDK